MKKVLITGHKGFLGRHFRRAMDGEWDIYGMDVNDDESRDVRRFVHGWFTDPEGLEVDNYLREEKFGDLRSYDLVIHLAGIVEGRKTIDGDPLRIAEDLEIDAAMIRMVRSMRPKRFVYMSSSAVYPVALQTGDGTLGYQHLVEDDVDLNDVHNPDMTYGWAKLTGEYVCGFLQEDGIPVTIVRPFSGYGEDQSLDYPFPSFVQRAVAFVDPFDIWGNGNQTRDFVHVSDVVGATLAAVEQGYDGPLNVCTGRPTNFRQLAEMVTSAAGYNPDRRYLTDKPRGVMYRVGDPARLHRVYVPKVPLEEGVQRAVTEKMNGR